ncbi:hypothetical protein SDRG_12236 [Saprolegnia diclina VS20]|uniref:Uncharacterized protein n=1 Tax=Saprolegnia diclina (strain VS20) TaxID=1156394 RepID=T0PWU7_SAPDV|nr:hypothetical protein SDRG_12236 [Saprolegnia diclina VS20]EQC29954.1 hypothetical protein SDRG_12236 [Saprolegnia diclina VS20]|eukprot:XP_008616521.1 hypothetical protein SDRG_12236 [Saprolegnia diclina VS20]
MTKRVYQRAPAPSLPCVILHGILDMVDNGRDVAALLSALPGLTLPPELVALRDLGAVVNLADHWPVVQVAKIPIQHARLGIAALPVFTGIKLGSGDAALAWLDVALPTTMPVTLSVSGKDFGTSYRLCVRPAQDILARCVNVQSVSIVSEISPAATAAYVAAISATHLQSLDINAWAQPMVDACAIVAWLQGPNAASLTLGCDSVRDPMALASAIQNCSTLSSLRLVEAVDVQAALVASAGNLHHVTALSLRQFGVGDQLARDLLMKLDHSKVRSFALDLAPVDDDDETPVADVLTALAECSLLEALCLDKLRLSTVPTSGNCAQLSTVAVRAATFETPDDVITLIQWLSTSQRLTSLDLSETSLGQAGVAALTEALPAWIARGLASLTLRATGLSDKDAAKLAAAIVSSHKRQHLAIDLTDNELTPYSVQLLTTTLGTTPNVTLSL